MTQVPIDSTGGRRRASALGVIATSFALAFLLAPPSQAAYEQTGCFAGHFPGLTESCKPLSEAELKAEGFKFGEEVQLGGVGGMAVNHTGAGGVPAGTVYAVVSDNSDVGKARIAAFTPTAGGGLELSLGWLMTTAEGPYERCGPDLEPTPTKCPIRVKSGPASVDVEVDQSTGNVYVYSGGGDATAGRKYIAVYEPDGSAVIARFGERVLSPEPTATHPELMHGTGGPSRNGLAVDDSGTVYFYDGNGYQRLMVFEPQSPGDYEHYVYAGEVQIDPGTGPVTKYPTLDEAGNVYVASDKVIRMYPPQTPAPYPAPAAVPACSFEFAAGGITTIAVDPLTGTPFFFTYKNPKRLYQLGPCDPETGQFTGGIVGETVVKPERDDLYGLAFDPVRKLTGRPAGVLYGGAPNPVSSVGAGKGEPGQSSLGYVFAGAAVPQKTLTVAKAGSGTGKVTSTPSGIDCGSDCDEEFAEGSEVTLSAEADAGSDFTGWSGSGCSGTANCIVTMSEAKSVTATFDEEAEEEPGIALTVATEGTGTGTVSSDKGAISCNPFCTDEYEAGTVVTLTATPTPGSVFYSWKYCDKGGVNGRQCTVTLDKAKTVKATFTTTHALTLTKVGGLGKVQSAPGGVLCLFNCSETTASFKEGTEVTLKQTPAKHFHFVQWGGDCTGSGACEVTMGEAHEVSALFTEDSKHLLTLTKQGGGAGTVKSSVAGINCGAACSEMASAYYQGTEVELTATPGKGSAFEGWSGGGCSGTGTCTVTMSEAREVTAEFG
ncbi:MAG TPA: hypothetical protein VIS51_11195 [Solirubrobacterales bacterium]